MAARAATRLLADRARHARQTPEPRPWPEFAEYNCYACHHDLAVGSYRQDQQHYGRRHPGTLPWGSWYFTMPRLLLETDETARLRLLPLLDQLTERMQKPAPDADRVAQDAALMADGLGNWLGQQQEKIDGAALLRLVANRASDGRWLADEWDRAEQFYLAFCALRRSPQDAGAQRLLDAVSLQLAFPPLSDQDRYDSPANYGQSRAKLRELFEHLGKEFVR